MALRRPRYVLKRSTDGKFYFILQAVNGEIMSTSEAYGSLPDCLRGAKDHKRVSRRAKFTWEGQTL